MGDFRDSIQIHSLIHIAYFKNILDLLQTQIKEETYCNIYVTYPNENVAYWEKYLYDSVPQHYSTITLFTNHCILHYRACSLHYVVLYGRVKEVFCWGICRSSKLIQFFKFLNYTAATFICINDKNFLRRLWKPVHTFTSESKDSKFKRFQWNYSWEESLTLVKVWGDLQYSTEMPPAFTKQKSKHFLMVSNCRKIDHSPPQPITVVDVRT